MQKLSRHNTWQKDAALETTYVRRPDIVKARAQKGRHFHRACRYWGPPSCLLPHSPWGCQLRRACGTIPEQQTTDAVLTGIAIAVAYPGRLTSCSIRHGAMQLQKNRGLAFLDRASAVRGGACTKRNSGHFGSAFLWRAFPPEKQSSAGVREESSEPPYARLGVSLGLLQPSLEHSGLPNQKKTLTGPDEVGPPTTARAGDNKDTFVSKGCGFWFMIVTSTARDPNIMPSVTKHLLCVAFTPQSAQNLHVFYVGTHSDGGPSQGGDTEFGFVSAILQVSVVLARAKNNIRHKCGTLDRQRLTFPALFETTTARRCTKATTG